MLMMKPAVQHSLDHLIQHISPSLGFWRVPIRAHLIEEEEDESLLDLVCPDRRHKHPESTVYRSVHSR